jgi:hypothetical protein
MNLKTHCQHCGLPAPNAKEVDGRRSHPVCANIAAKIAKIRQREEN